MKASEAKVSECVADVIYRPKPAVEKKEKIIRIG